MKSTSPWSPVCVREHRPLQHVKHVLIDLVVGSNVLLLRRVAPFVIRFGVMGCVVSIALGCAVFQVESVEGEEEGEEVVVDALVRDLHRLHVQLGEVPAAAPAAAAQEDVAQKSGQSERLDVCRKMRRLLRKNT